MTKPIIVVKMPCKLLYVIQVKGFLKCSTSWPCSLAIYTWGKYIVKTPKVLTYSSSLKLITLHTLYKVSCQDLFIII